MIDTVRFVWGHAAGTAERRVHVRTRGRTADRDMPEPVYLDVDELVDRLGVMAAPKSGIAATTTKHYDGKAPRYGHWKDLGPHNAIDLMYGEGRLELRCSLPKLAIGRNDVVLDERGTHDAFRLLERTALELTGVPLNLREGRPARLDPCWQWHVPSVGFVLEHLKATFRPPRTDRADFASPRSRGRSLEWGLGTRRVIRFYDKGAKNLAEELQAIGRGLPHFLDPAALRAMNELERKAAIGRARRDARERLIAGADLDVLLRYEIQEQRSSRLRLIHEAGYRAVDIEHELRRTIASIAAVALRDVEALLAASHEQWAHGVAYTLGALYLADHDELWPVMRRIVSNNAYYAWRRRAAARALEVGEWAPTIPADPFDGRCSLWTTAAAPSGRLTEARVNPESSDRSTQGEAG